MTKDFFHGVSVFQGVLLIVLSLLISYDVEVYRANIQNFFSHPNATDSKIELSTRTTNATDEQSKNKT